MSVISELALPRNDGRPLRRKDMVYSSAGIGTFTSFSGLPIRHGFTWGPTSKNMAYAHHPLEADPDIITQRNANILQSLGMSRLRQAIVIEAYANQEIRDITPEYLTEATATSRGIFTPAHVVFTTLPEVPLLLKPGDCLASCVYGVSRDKQPIVGLIHSGRNELTEKIPKKAIKHLQETYRCDPADIKVGIVPGLGVANHTLLQIDADIEGATTIWNNHAYTVPEGIVHFDGLRFLTEQLTHAGVPDANIELYDIDTYEAAKRGETYSHRYTTTTEERSGRFLVAIQLNR